MKRLFGTDGIRGIVGKELDIELAYNVGSALTKVLLSKEGRSPKILIGMDTRASSPMLSSAFMNGIREMGGMATNIGVCSTPAVAYHVIKHAFDAGVMISASHNPYEYNGIKIFGKDGFKISDEIEARIEEIVFGNNLNEITAREEYIDYLKKAFNCSLSGLKIGIDCANGSASVTAKELFESLGAECHILSDNPNGKNINLGCGSTYLDGLKSLVISKSLDVGIAFDGDADRCIAIDEKGREIDGDFILAILSLRMKSEERLNKNVIVGTVMTNLGLRKFCADNNIGFECSAVGDRYVLEKLRLGEYSLGGEQSGHIIFSDIATTGDGQLTAVALLSEMKKSGKSLSALASAMKKYPQKCINIEADAIDKTLLINDNVIQEIIKEGETLFDSGRIVVRPSGTEPLIRIRAECITEEEAELICHHLANKIKGRLRELKTTVG